MAVVLHALEALPGQGRYAAHFRNPDGTTQTAVVHVEGAAITAAEASLPAGWVVGSAEFAALADVVLAMQRARDIVPAAADLSDVDGGWDVMLGNVVLVAGVPSCTAHGALQTASAGVYECAECGARALYAA